MSEVFNPYQLPDSINQTVNYWINDLIHFKKRDVPFLASLPKKS